MNHETLSTDLRGKVDDAVHRALEDTGVPSASIAIVKDGQIAYLHAYGHARLSPPVLATTEMAYHIGSITKQFTATAVLMLVEQGKLSLDDKVSKYLPKLTRAGEITIRQLLSHTSGYQDYWPQDCVPPLMARPTTAEEILQRWACKPLDFDPGTKWQYSNTNYVAVGLIAEKVSGERLFEFLQKNIFAPLNMQRIQDVNLKPLADTDPTGYTHYALGPSRIAPDTGPGWLFATGELAMLPRELAKWDIAMLTERLLKPESYKQMQTEIKLKNGSPTGYALGVHVEHFAGHRVIRHGGATPGFTAQNYVFPDDRAALVVLTNQDAAGAAAIIATQVSNILLGVAIETSAQKLQRDRKILEELQYGRIDRAIFTSDANSYFSNEVLADYDSSLRPLGDILQFTLTDQRVRGGMAIRSYKVSFAKKNVAVKICEMPDGTLEQYLVRATD